MEMRSNPNLFARIPEEEAKACYECWPEHKWSEKSLFWLLKKPINQQIKNISLNVNLLESIKKNGFENPFLFTHEWYPVCGSQRLRCAMELTERQQKKIKVKTCRFAHPVYNVYRYYPGKEDALKAMQIYIAMAEVTFKTLYCKEQDSSGVPMLKFEQEGDAMHWDVRDGSKNNNQIVLDTRRKF